MYEDEIRAVKQAAYEKQAQTSSLNQGTCGQALGATPYRPPTLREEAEKSVNYHYEEANKQSIAANFFRENPAFDEFIRLVRSGSIRF